MTPARLDFAPCRPGKRASPKERREAASPRPVRHGVAGAEVPPRSQATQLNNEVSTLSGDLTKWILMQGRQNTPLPGVHLAFRFLQACHVDSFQSRPTFHWAQSAQNAQYCNITRAIYQIGTILEFTHFLSAAADGTGCDRLYLFVMRSLTFRHVASAFSPCSVLFSPCGVLSFPMGRLRSPHGMFGTLSRQLPNIPFMPATAASHSLNAPSWPIWPLFTPPP